MHVILARPRGFCAGVQRAIKIVERALECFGAPIYVRHEVVHNQFVVDKLKRQGAIFIERLSEVPPDSTLIFSAHGVSRAVREEAQARGFQVFDATCPLVTKVHLEVTRQHQKNKEIIMIGHRGHPEVEGTMGQVQNGMHLVEKVEDVAHLDVRHPNRLAFVTQTTLSIDDARQVIAALKQRFPLIAGPKKDDVCYATQNRQDAIKALSRQCTMVIVVGSPASSNSRRLREVARNQGVTAYQVDRAEDIDPYWITGENIVGVTAGASAPEILVEQVIQRLRQLGATSVEEITGVEEHVVFPLPKMLATIS